MGATGAFLYKLGGSMHCPCTSQVHRQGSELQLPGHYGGGNAACVSMASATEVMQGHTAIHACEAVQGALKHLACTACSRPTTSSELLVGISCKMYAARSRPIGSPWAFEV